MKLLAIDTSSKVASAALFEEDHLVCACDLMCGLTHSQRLMPLVEDCFALAGWQPGQVDYFAVVRGPGSFTGVRIGVSAVKGMADALGKPVVGVNTLETLAASLPFAQGLVVPLLDARRGQVYAAAYRWDGDGMTTVIPPCAMALSEFLQNPALSGQLTFLGDGATANADILAQVENGRLAPPHVRHQRAAAAGYLALSRLDTAMPAGDIEPLYLRDSQAEQTRQEKLRREEAARA